jgi:hypothetical protein
LTSRLGKEKTIIFFSSVLASITLLCNSLKFLYSTSSERFFKTDLFFPLFLLFQPPLLLLFLPLGLGCLLFPARRTLDVDPAHGLEDAGLVAQPQLVEAAVEILQSLRRKLVLVSFYKKG